MTTIKTFRSAALATLAVAAVSIPTLAQARGYNSGFYNPSAECKAKENDAQIVGGIVGAIVGGVVGSQVSGNGARTEGSAVGALLGGLAGAGIGDESVDCDKQRRRAYNRTYSGQTYGRGQPIAHHPGTYRRNDRGYRNSDYRNDRRCDRNYRNTRHDHRTHPYDPNCNDGYIDRRRHSSGLQDQLNDVRYRLRDLRRENRRLERRIRNDHRRGLVRRQEIVCDEIRRLERKERRLSRRVRNQRRTYY